MTTTFQAALDKVNVILDGQVPEGMKKSELSPFDWVLTADAADRDAIRAALPTAVDADLAHKYLRGYDAPARLLDLACVALGEAPQYSSTKVLAAKAGAQ